MNNFDLQTELDKNETDKQIANTEIEVSKNKWAEYVIKNKDEICSYHKPIIVKKKRRAKLGDFLNKIKIILGLKQKEDKTDGIETYLQYCNNIE